MIITDQLGRHHRAVADQSQDAVQKEKKNERDQEQSRGWLGVIERENGCLKRTESCRQLK